MIVRDELAIRNWKEARSIVERPCLTLANASIALFAFPNAMFLNFYFANGDMYLKVPEAGTTPRHPLSRRERAI